MLTQGRGGGGEHIMIWMFYVLITCLDYFRRGDKKKYKLSLFFMMFWILCLQAAKEKQKIRAEEIQIDVVERKKEIEVEEKEVSRKDKELFATVRRPAEAESYRVETIAQGKRYAMV